MKQEVPDLISNLLASLLNHHMSKLQETSEDEEVRKRKTKLEFPKTDEDQKEKIVDEILRKRKDRVLLGCLLGLVVIVVLIFIFLSF